MILRSLQLLFIFSLLTDFAFTQEATAKVRILVNSAYDNSDTTLQYIEKLASLLPPTKTQLKVGETISHVILDNYKFGPSNLFYPSKFLEEKILQLNGYEKPEDVLPGEIIIPTIAPRSRLTPNSNNYNNVLPKIANYSGFYENGQFLFQDDIVVDDFRRIGAQETYMEIEIPLEVLDSLEENGLGDFSSSILSADLDFEFEFDNDSSSVSSEENFFNIDFDELKLLIRKNGVNRKTYLFILDSGWPNEVVQKESISKLSKILDQIWNSLGITPPTRTFPPFQKATCNHCEHVYSSIQQLLSLNPGAVEVIFLPLSKEQGGDIILAELIRLHKVLSDNRLSRNFNSIDYQLRGNTLRRIDREVKWILEKLPKEIGTRCESRSISIRTDYSIIYALQDIADYISEKENTSYFINLSWNPQRNRTHLKTTDIDRGYFVVSAGNNGRDIIKMKRPFGNLISKRSDIVVGFNVDPNSFIAKCNSNTISTPHDQRRIKGIALGYYGDLGPSNCGGTSFSSPRLAWFLALGEAIRNNYSLEREIRPNIEKNVQESLYFEDSNPFKAIWFNPITYLNNINIK